MLNQNAFTIFTKLVKSFPSTLNLYLFYPNRVEPVQLTFMIVGAAMGGLGLMILFLGCLSTGSTRAKVYRTWRGRVGGRVSCAIVSITRSRQGMNEFLIV